MTATKRYEDVKFESARITFSNAQYELRFQQTNYGHLVPNDRIVLSMPKEQILCLIQQLSTLLTEWTPQVTAEEPGELNLDPVHVNQLEKRLRDRLQEWWFVRSINTKDEYVELEVGHTSSSAAIAISLLPHHLSAIKTGIMQITRREAQKRTTEELRKRLVDRYTNAISMFSPELLKNAEKILDEVLLPASDVATVDYVNASLEPNDHLKQAIKEFNEPTDKE